METTKIIYLFAKLRAAPKGLCLIINMHAWLDCGYLDLEGFSLVQILGALSSICA